MVSTLRVNADVEVTGNITLNGVVQTPSNGELLTSNDAMRLDGGAAMPMGAAVPGESNDWSGWRLPAGGDAAIGFARSWPSNWLTARLTWGYVPLTNVAGNVRWRVRVKRASVSVDLISAAAENEFLITQAAGTFLQMQHVFGVIYGIDFGLHDVSPPFGEVVHIKIERLVSDALDTYDTGDILLTNFSVNRLT